MVPITERSSILLLNDFWRVGNTTGNRRHAHAEEGLVSGLGKICNIYILIQYISVFSAYGSPLPQICLDHSFIALNLCRRSLCKLTAKIEHRDMIADSHDHIHVVINNQNCRSI